MLAVIARALRVIAPAAAALLALAPPAAAALEFTRLDTGPELPPRAQLLRDGATHYALAGHLVFRSADARAWTLLAGQPPEAADRIAVAANQLYALGADRIHASADAGASWSDITGELTGIIEIHGGAGALFAITVEQAGGTNYRLWRRAPGDSAWQLVLTSTTDAYQTLIEAGDRLCLTAGNGGIRYSTDGGLRWSTASGISGQAGVIAASEDGSTVLAAAASNSVTLRRSLNGCQSFSSLGSLAAPNGASLSALGLDRAGNAYAGFSDGTILKGPSTGTSLDADNGGALPARSQLTITGFARAGDAMLASTAGGLYHDAGGDWAPAHDGIRTAFIHALLAGRTDDAALHLGAVGGHQQSDAPLTTPFAPRNSGLAALPVYALLRSGTALLAGTAAAIDNSTFPATGEIGLQRSLDDGASWTALGAGSGLPPGARIEHLASDGSRIYAAVTSTASGSGRGLYLSTDDGATWSAVAAMANAQIRNLAGTPGALYVYVGNLGVYRSDNGSDFIAVNNGLGGSRFGKVFAYSGGLIASAGNVVHRSTDNGENWTAASGFAVSRFGIELLALAEDADGVLYLGDEHAGLSVSTDGGATWTPDSDGLMQAETCIPRVQSLLVRGATLYAGTGGPGLYASPVLGDRTPGDSVPCTTDTDVFPNAFTLAGQSNVAPGTVIIASAVIGGLASGVRVPVSVDNGEVAVIAATGDCATASYADSAQIAAGERLCARHFAAATGETRTTTQVRVGDQRATLVSTTGLVYSGRPEEINTGFGSNGFARPAAAPAEVRVLDSGRIVSAGSVSVNRSNDFSVSLFEADGTPVSGFGSNGQVTVDFGGSDTLTTVLALPDGGLLLVGYSFVSGSAGTSSELVLAQLRADGSLDPAFGDAGIVRFDVHPTPDTQRLEIAGEAQRLADGSILVSAAVVTNSTGTRFLAVKFSASGAVDPSFGTAEAQFSAGVAASPSLGTSSISAHALRVLADGRFVIGGRSQPSFSTLAGTLVRFTADGSVDASFGSGGRVDVPSASDVQDLLPADGGGLIVIGQARVGSATRPMVASLDADGAPDTAFAGDGVFTLDAVSGVLGSGERLADGSIFALGSGTGADGSQQLLTLRLRADGTLDPDYGPADQGYSFRGPINGSAVSGGSSALRSDGGVLIGGAFNGPALFVLGGGDTPPPVDTTPDAFAFEPAKGVAPGSTVLSNAVTILGIDAPAAVSVAGGEYAIGCAAGSFTAAAGTIDNGQTVCLRHSAATAPATATTTTLTVGGVSAAFTSTTADAPPPDTTPDAFAFADLADVEPLAQVTSAPVTISGIDAPAAVSVENGLYAIGCIAPYVSAPGSVENGQTICLRHTAAEAFGTAVNTRLTVGGVSDTFTSMTRADQQAPDTTPDAFQISDVTGATPGSRVISAAVTISGIDAPAPLQVSGGEYRINGGEFTDVDGSVVAGDRVELRITAGGAGTTVSATLSVGGVSDSFSVTAAAQSGGAIVLDPQNRPVSVNSSAGAVENLASVATPAGAPAADTAYPNGFFSFRVTGLAPGASAELSFVLPAAGANGYVKCIGNRCAALPADRVRVVGRTLTVTLTDGGDYDADGLADGTITDPGAPAVLSTEATLAGGGSLSWGALLPGLLVLLRRRGALLALLAGLLPASAQAAEPAFYAGLRAGPTQSRLDDAQLSRELQARGHAASARVDGSDSGGTLYLGYRLADAAAVELGWTQLGEYRTQLSGTPADPQRMIDDAAALMQGGGDALSLALRYELPLAGPLRLAPRLGAYGWRSEVAIERGGVRSRAQQEGIGALLGLGLSLDLPGRWRAGVGYEVLRSTAEQTIALSYLQLEYGWQ